MTTEPPNLQDPSWDCDAYGSEGVRVGALCFFSPPDQRSCASAAECASKMTAERQRIFDHIHQKAATGDPFSVALANQFSSPDQLLGAPGATAVE